jgi:TolA-binding protein
MSNAPGTTTAFTTTTWQPHANAGTEALRDLISALTTRVDTLESSLDQAFKDIHQLKQLNRLLGMQLQSEHEFARLASLRGDNISGNIARSLGSDSGWRTLRRDQRWDGRRDGSSGSGRGCEDYGGYSWQGQGPHVAQLRALEEQQSNADAALQESAERMTGWLSQWERTSHVVGHDEAERRMQPLAQAQAQGPEQDQEQSTC